MNNISKCVISFVAVIAIFICSFEFSVFAEGTSNYKKRNSLYIGEYLAHKDSYTEFELPIGLSQERSFSSKYAALLNNRNANACNGVLFPDRFTCGFNAPCKKCETAMAPYICTDTYKFSGIGFTSENKPVHFYGFSDKPLLMSDDGNVYAEQYNVTNFFEIEKNNLVFENNTRAINGKININQLSPVKQIFFYSGSFINDKGEPYVLEENFIDTSDLFNKPYHKLSEWNALMDSKGEKYQKYKIKSKKDVPSASAMLKGLKDNTWSLVNDSYANGQYVESILKSQILRNTNFIYEVSDDLKYKEIHTLTPLPNMSFHKVIDNTVNSFVLYGPQQSKDKENGVTFLEVYDKLKQIEVRKIKYSDTGGGFYGIAKGKTFIIDDTFAFDGKYDADGKPIKDTEIGDDGSTNINGIEKDDGTKETIGNGYNPNDYKPQKPTGINPIEWIDYWTSNIGTFFTDVSNGVTGIANKTSSFFGFLGSTFSFIPTPIWTLILASVGVIVILRIFGR